MRRWAVGAIGRFLVCEGASRYPSESFANEVTDYDVRPVRRSRSRRGRVAKTQRMTEVPAAAKAAW
jgi:hypothetical protein